MKRVYTILFGLAIVGLAGLISCGGDDEPTPKQKTINLLTSKNTWTLNSVIVPPQTATIEDDWQGFNVSFTQSSMTTQGYPDGCSAVWPSGTYTVSEDGQTITSSAAPAGWSLSISTLTEAAFNSVISVPDGTEKGRVEALDGEYTFNMK
jgi:hypothetical protein